MSDVRALLKAKRQEARINHPLASYTDAGVLRCLACGPVKHASAWEGHLGSKQHRTTLARLKEQERARKRKADDLDDSDTEQKRRKVDGIPGDFFSDSSRAPPPPPSDDEDDAPDSLMPPAPSAPAPSIDAEWERFQREVINTPDHREAYEHATIMAEPQLASETPEGFPSQQMVSDDGPEQPTKLEEDDARRQREQDDRELIMDRLLDEERAQEEADMKVMVMKNRLDALVRKRNAAKAAKLNAKGPP